MKATINVEYTGEEIERLISNMVGHRLLKFVGGFSQEQVQWFLAGIQQAMGTIVGQVGAQPQRDPRPSGAPPGPFRGPFGSPPGMVQPIHGESPHVDRCFAIEANRNTEVGIGCCQCATNNALTRTNCRRCGHKLCVVVTPSPAEGPVREAPE